MAKRDWYKDAGAIAIITLIATVVSTNGFQFHKIFFPADILSGFSSWRSTFPGASEVRNPLIADPILEFEPWEKLIQTAIFAKRWPLWNPYSFMGSPLLGNGQISAFTIFSLPLHFLSDVPAHFFEALLKLCIAGASMYFLGRALHLGRTAALVAGIVYMLSGHMLAWLHFPLSGGVALAPLLLIAAERTLQKSSALWFFVLVVSMAMLAVCGQPQTTFTIGLLLAVFFIYRSLQYRRMDTAESWRVRALRSTLGMILGLGLSSFQTLPFLEYLQLSAAQMERNAYNVFYLPLYQLITLLLPDFFGNVVHGNYWGYANNVGPAMYVGVLPMLLAATAVLVATPDADTRFFAACAFICLIIITKQFGVEQLVEIPILAGITINKFIAPFTLSTAFLAGKAIDIFWVRPKAVLKTCTVLLALSGIYVIATSAYFSRWLTELKLEYYELQRGIPLFAFTPFAILLLWIWQRRSVPLTADPNHGRLVFPAFVFVITAVADPTYYWLNFNPSIDSRLFYPTPESVEFLKQDREVWRLMNIGDALPPNTSSYFHLQDSLGYDGMTYKRYYDFMSVVDSSFKDLAATLEIEKLPSKPWNPRTSLFEEYVRALLRSKGAGFLPYLKQAYFWNTTVRRFDNRRLLDLMNVKYIVAPPSWSPDTALQDLTLVYDKGVRLYWNRTALPRAIVVSQWKWANSDEETIQLMSDPRFDPTAMAILQRSTASKTAQQRLDSPTTDRNQTGSAKLLSYESEKVVLEADASDNALLLLSDAYYPGWKCTVDGNEKEILIADFLFRAVQLPQGRHQVIFSYEPASFTLGLRLSLLSGLATLISAVWIHVSSSSPFPRGLTMKVL